MRFVADDTLRVLEEGRVLIGGSPTRVLRLSARGAEVVRGILAGEAPEPTPVVSSLLDRLLTAGAIHPLPQRGSFEGSVSVVIPTVGRDVTGLVESFPPGTEVTVIDDRERRGPAAARNSGWRTATGDVVVFIDDDCSPTDGWLESLLAHFADPRTVAVAPRIVTPSDGDALSRYEERRSPLDLGPRTAPVIAGTRVSYVPSATLAVRRSALAEVGGFDEALRFGEDVDLVWRLASAGGRVRYEPASVVEHSARAGLRDWLRQRFEYGTSAASLAKRHPGALTPLRVSPWSTLAWAAVAAGHPAIGAAVATTTTALLPRKLTMVERPWPEALRLAGLGHLFAARQIADALIRAWWPLALVAAVVSRRARRAVFAAAVIPPLLEWVRRWPRLDPLRWTALRILDDLAYGAGVWAGCARERTLDPLVPQSPPLFGSDSTPSPARGVGGRVRR